MVKSYLDNDVIQQLSLIVAEKCSNSPDDPSKIAEQVLNAYDKAIDYFEQHKGDFQAKHPPVFK